MREVGPRLREAIALAGEIVSKSQIAAQAQETVTVSTFLWFLVFLLLYECARMILICASSCWLLCSF